MGRIMVFTGKGGVGKSSLAAAHARLSAGESKKTLLVSTDMAHNLCDIFQVKVGKEVENVSENLDILEIDPNYVMEHEMVDMKQVISNMLAAYGVNQDNLLQISFFPGMDELFALLKIQEIYQTGEYERIIIDCAPTGETLSLLKFPELLSWYMEKFFPVGKVAMRVLSPLSKAIFKIELPDKDAMSDIEKMYVRLLELQELLKNKEITSIRLVTIPEKMVVEETKRNYMYMNLYNFQVDGLYINRMLPQDMNNSFFKEWIGIQKNYIEELESVFSGMPIYHIPWFDSDLNGFAGIDRMAECFKEKKNIFAILNAMESEQYEPLENGYQMKLYLPCIEKGEVDLHSTESEVIVKIGNFKRNIPLPNALRKYEISSAKFEEGYLNIMFLKS